MLILTREIGRSIVIGKDIKLTIIEIDRGNIKFSISAPKNVAVFREEVWQRIQKEKGSDG